MTIPELIKAMDVEIKRHARDVAWKRSRIKYLRKHVRALKAVESDYIPVVSAVGS